MSFFQAHIYKTPKMMYLSINLPTPTLGADSMLVIVSISVSSPTEKPV